MNVTIERAEALRELLAQLHQREVIMARVAELVGEQGKLFDTLRPAAEPFLGLGLTEAFRLAGVGRPEWARIRQLGDQVAMLLAQLGPPDELGSKGATAVARVRAILGRLR